METQIDVSGKIPILEDVYFAAELNFAVGERPDVLFFESLSVLSSDEGGKKILHSYAMHVGDDVLHHGMGGAMLERDIETIGALLEELEEE